MPRNISFMLTTEQILDRSKTVTRRLGWESLQPGTLLNGCRKCMGLAKGERVERLVQIRVTNVRRESLSSLLVEPYGSDEARREGFPDLNGAGFVAMFCDKMDCNPQTLVTRIEFEYRMSERQLTLLDC